MATVTINTLSEGTGPRFNPGVGDDGLVLPDAVLVATTGAAILVDNEQSMSVFGFAYGDTDGIRAELVDGSEIFIGASGRVTGGTNGVKILSAPNGNAALETLVNNGEIMGIGDDGVDGAGSNFRLLNNGSITGAFGVFYFSSAATDVEIINTGTISSWVNGGGFGIQLVISSGGRILNSGLITNGIFFGSFAGGMVVNNTGSIQASSSGNAINGDGGGFGDVITNAGSITGAVTTGAGADTVANTGKIIGNILLGDDADLYRAGPRGIVDGTVSGGAGNDRLIGGREDDVLSGGEEDDVLRGNAGDDTLQGDGGNDVIESGTGDDVYMAGTGDGNDDLDGGDGIDTYDASAVTTNIIIRLQEQRATGSGTGNDTVQFFENAFGGLGNDKLVGDSGRNVLRGNEGADNINGLEGNDRIVGGAGGDVIIGSTGGDVLTGGDDADTFDFNSTTESTVGASNRDLVTDFAQATDLIDLLNIDANTTAGGNQAFSFIGSGAFASVAGQLRFTASGASNYTIVEGDVNGDAKADFQIGFTGIIVFLAGDFIL